MKILFITANRLGDAVISSGLLAALIQRYPDARVTVVCGPVAASFFVPCPQVSEVITLVKARHDRHWLSLWQRCRRTRWDLIVDLRGSAVSYFLRARARKILRGGRRPGARVGHVAGLFGLLPAPLPTAWSTGEQISAASAHLPAGIRYLALAPTANWDGKIWAPEHFVTVARQLAEEGYVPAVFYGPGLAERGRALPVLDSLAGALDLGGDRPIGEVAALLSRCALFVGNDSGLMHLAAATGTPTLGIFGPSRASEYAPSGRCAGYVVAPGPEGAGNLVELRPETVLAACRDLLACQAPRGQS